MTCEEARQILWREPFQPCRIRLKDGRTFDIRHLNLALAAEAILIIGIPPAEEPEAWYSDRTLWVRWPDVEAIEPLPTPATAGQFQAPVSRRASTMTCEQARQYLWREPFQPCRIRLTDGRTFEVRHSTLILAAEAILILGIPPTDEPDAWYSDRRLWVKWPDVEAIEPLSTPAASVG
jgi:hypothetical protein